MIGSCLFTDFAYVCGVCACGWFLVLLFLSFTLMGTHMWTHFFSPAIKRQTFAPHPSAFFVCLYVCVYVFIDLLDLYFISGRFFPGHRSKNRFLVLSPLV